MDKYALLGEKLSHSYSPLIQNKLFKVKNIDASYSLYELKEDELKEALDKLRNGLYKGYNVTIPYKEKVIKYLDYITPHAKEIGAVNTVYFKDGKLCGDNTDYYGFTLELKDLGINPKGKDTYILGTGGASKAIRKALIDLGANIYLVSRTKNPDTITYDMLSDRKLDIIVNTTPLGMYPNVDASPLKEDIARNASVIVDIIFNPKETLLMKYNKNSYNGLKMLFYQAAKAQDIWLGEINYPKDILEELEKEIYSE